MNAAKLPDDAKKEIKEILNDLSNSFIDHLSQPNHNTDKIDAKTELIYQFIEKHNEELSGGVKQKIFRFIIIF